MPWTLLKLGKDWIIKFMQLAWLSHGSHLGTVTTNEQRKELKNWLTLSTRGKRTKVVKGLTEVAESSWKHPPKGYISAGSGIELWLILVMSSQHIQQGNGLMGTARRFSVDVVWLSPKTKTIIRPEHSISANKGCCSTRTSLKCCQSHYHQKKCFDGKFFRMVTNPPWNERCHLH